MIIYILIILRKLRKSSKRKLNFQEIDKKKIYIEQGEFIFDPLSRDVDVEL